MGSSTKTVAQSLLNWLLRGNIIFWEGMALSHAAKAREIQGFNA
jgi:hypothetical protein